MWVSILGIYNHDNTIFDHFILPEHVDKNILVNLILFRAAELEILYAEPELLKKIYKLLERNTRSCLESSA